MGEKRSGSHKIISDFELDQLIDISAFDVGSDTGSFLPYADLVETADFFVLEIEVAGIKKEHLAIEVSDNYIYVSGKKERGHKDIKDKMKYYCMGRIYGVFKRVFEIPLPFNMHGVKAKLENGVLTITLPKIVNKRQKRIKVEIE